MKKIILFITVFVFILISTNESFGQTAEISGQFRPRYEMRHGYKTLTPDGAQAANFISQRTRLNFGCTNEFFNLGFSVQNVGVWGETGTLSSSDVNGTAIHEAWGELIFCEKFSLKAGRQEIMYDDQRIFGNVDWAQQGRHHDAVILKIKPKEECTIDLGFAYNAMKETDFKENYTVNNYKTFQYVHWHRSFNAFGVSILALNNGLPWISSDTTESGNFKEKVAYSQTIGARGTYKKEKIKVNAAFYIQTGKVTIDTTNDNIMDATKDLSAMYFAADAAFAISEMFSIGAGFEYFTGNSMKDPDKKDQAFKPLYGTNHKFNGWMDYFYVGSFMNSVGLLDIYLPFTFTKDKISAALIPHYFSAANDVYGFDENGNGKDYSNGLGTEVDLVFGYQVAKNATVKVGYSQMFATESMQVLKGGNYENTNNWAWVMIDFKPSFFKSEKNK